MDVELYLFCQALYRLSDIVSIIVYSYGDVPIGGEGFKIWPIVGIGGHWAVRVLQRATPTVTGTSVYIGHLQ